jgi:hypothetical protein
MASSDNIDKFFDAINEAYDALLDAVKTANDRGYRVSRKLIDEVERGQRDAVDLTRRLATAPRDVVGFYTAAVRNVTDVQGRTLDLTRQFLDELSDSGREARDTARKVIEANRDAGQAVISATREGVQRAAPAAQQAAQQAVNGVRARTTSTRRAAKSEIA